MAFAARPPSWPVVGRRSRSAVVVAAAARAAQKGPSIVGGAAPAVRSADAAPFSKLAGVPVLRSADGSSLLLREAWDAPGGERALLVLARSFGCPFCQAAAREIARDLLAPLDAAGVRLAFVGIGTAERARDFSARTGLPPGVLYADPANAAYDALGLEASFAAAFLSPQTPLALARRAAGKGGGNLDDLRAMLRGWAPWQPPQGVRQALNQGGAFLFEGDACVWSHRDAATGAHAEPSELLARAVGLAAGAPGGGGGGGAGAGGGGGGGGGDGGRDQEAAAAGGA